MYRTHTPAGEEPRFHGVRFWDNERALYQSVADYVCAGLVLNQPALLIAIPEHRTGIMAALDAAGYDARQLEANGRLLNVDANAFLAIFMSDGVPDMEQFRLGISRALERLQPPGTPGMIRAYGELVNVLWKAGRRDAAIQLEEVWNELSTRHSFALLCGYGISNWYAEGDMARICSCHSHIVGKGGVGALESPTSIVH